MTDAIDDERQRIRERKLRELQERLDRDGAGGPNATGATAATNATEQSPTDPIEITDERHFSTVLSEHSVVLVDCHADWCGPCRMLEPTIDAIAAETAATVAKVDIDARREIAARLGVRSVPTLVLYVDGEPVERLLGVQDRTTLEGLVRKHI